MELKDFLTETEEWFKNHTNNKDDATKRDLEELVNGSSDYLVCNCMDALYAPNEYWNDIQNKLIELAKKEL